MRFRYLYPHSFFDICGEMENQPYESVEGRTCCPPHPATGGKGRGRP
ncbi:hypothetical protein HMPREF0239_00262 [Clostridium sp. ATCC BAA-442]|nr:hypothetical protein HMPREF0239_00262 [Clostridium sp. ATCC BAA-442]